MLLETKEQQLIGYFCNYFVDLKTLLDNKDKLNLTEECVKIIENKLENGPKTINKYLPYGELFDQLYPLYEKNHKMEIDPDDSESVKRFRDEFIKKYGDAEEQDYYYKNLLSDLRENHGITKEEMNIINKEDENKMDLDDAIERIHQKELDICELIDECFQISIRMNLNNRIFALIGGSQKTIEDLYPGSYEIFCELASLGKEVCTEDFFERIKLTNSDPEYANIFKYTFFSQTHSHNIEKNLLDFYPQKGVNQIKDDCSKIILGEEKRKEIICEKFKKIYNFIDQDVRKNLPEIDHSNRSFFKFCMKTSTVARLLVKEFN